MQVNRDAHKALIPGDVRKYRKQGKTKNEEEVAVSVAVVTAHACGIKIMSWAP